MNHKYFLVFLLPFLLLSTIHAEANHEESFRMIKEKFDVLVAEPQEPGERQDYSKKIRMINYLWFKITYKTATDKDIAKLAYNMLSVTMDRTLDTAYDFRPKCYDLINLIIENPSANIPEQAFNLASEKIKLWRDFFRQVGVARLAKIPGYHSLSANGLTIDANDEAILKSYWEVENATVSAMKLMVELVKHGHYYQEALLIAQESLAFAAAASLDLDIDPFAEQAMKLMTELVKKDYRIDTYLKDTVEYAQKLINSQDEDASIYDFFVALIEKGYAWDEALTSVCKILEEELYPFNLDAFIHLIKTLLARDYGTFKIEQALKNLLQAEKCCSVTNQKLQEILNIIL